MSPRWKWRLRGGTVLGEKRLGQGQGLEGPGWAASPESRLPPPPEPSQPLLLWPSQPWLSLALTGSHGGPGLGLGLLEASGPFEDTAPAVVTAQPIPRFAGSFHEQRDMLVLPT